MHKVQVSVLPATISVVALRLPVLAAAGMEVRQ